MEKWPKGENYVYNPANRLTSVNGQAYTWDDNGNLVNDGNSKYRYDQAGHLISTTLGSTTSLFNYNGDGARLRQIIAGVPTTYTQDPSAGSGQALAAPLPVVLQSKTGANATQYVYALGTRPLAQYGSSWEYLLADALGSVRQIVDANGNTKPEKYINRVAAFGSGCVINSALLAAISFSLSAVIFTDLMRL